MILNNFYFRKNNSNTLDNKNILKILLILLILIINICFNNFQNVFANSFINTTGQALFSKNAEIVTLGKAYDNLPNYSINNNIPLTATSVVLMDSKTGKILFEKNMNDKSYPASITKIMTALLAIEFADGDYSQRIKFTKDAVLTLPIGSSNIAMNVGDTLSLDQALYGMMLASANEVANAISEFFGISQDNFSKMMTKRATELGATNTNFANPNGLYEESHFTTAHDMALITKEALTYPEFIRYIKTQNYFIPPTEKQSLTRPLKNSHRMIIPSNDYYDSRVVGGKTGYTQEAGHTMVTYAKHNNLGLICVVMNASRDGAFTDTETLLNYGFNNYKQVSLLENSNVNKAVSVFQTVGNNKKNIGEVNVTGAKDEDNIVIPSYINKDEIIASINLPEEINAPVAFGQELGSATFSYKNQNIATISLVSDDGINKVSTLSSFVTIANKNEKNKVTLFFENAKTTALNIISKIPIQLVFCVIIILILAIALLVDFSKHLKFKNARKKKRDKISNDRIRIISREYNYKD